MGSTVHQMNSHTHNGVASDNATLHSFRRTLLRRVDEFAGDRPTLDFIEEEHTFFGLFHVFFCRGVNFNDHTRILTRTASLTFEGGIDTGRFRDGFTICYTRTTHCRLYAKFAHQAVNQHL